MIARWLAQARKELTSQRWGDDCDMEKTCTTRFEDEKRGGIWHRSVCGEE
jgi:hypothetical protein